MDWLQPYILAAITLAANPRTPPPLPALDAAIEKVMRNPQAFP